ncbi:putative bifunctional diguanylate cyclase/phosphodiesterase [Neptunicella marina]|uniref:EAL domain-containing protein n=1 Tax=Neptunicella marina TaxID=2125989 RepID=A0A8J6IV90_9ALTE|nr:EAL domain-containing protein [Neptunicella marina]MBC3766849.1 EAL domain-containing protein [Neptunicella marina]
MYRRKSIALSSRRIRFQLLVICSVVAVLIATLFSYVAYRLTSDVSQEVAQRATAEQSQMILQQVQYAFSHERIQPHQLTLPDNLLQRDYQLRVSLNGDIIYQRQHGAPISLESSSLDELKQTSDNNSGWLNSGENRFVWALASEPSSGLSVLLVKQNTELALRLNSAAADIWFTVIFTSCLAIIGALAIAMLISRQHSAFSSALEYRTSHDTLTGCYNRDYLLSQINEYIAHQISRDANHIQQHQASLLLIDINRFKEVNDALGHACGDVLLKRLSKEFATLLDNDDMLARFGGDEFAIWLPVKGAEKAELLARHLINQVQQPVNIDGIYLEVSLSIGISTFPLHGTSSEALISRADIAMYSAKRNRLGLAHFDPAQDAGTVERLKLTAGLRKALFLEQMVLYYQPQVCLKTNAIVGCEVLVRWQHPELGLLFPDKFIDVVECSGLVNDFTRYIIEHALEQNARWRQMGFEFPVSVNVSPYNLNDPQLLNFIEEKLRKYQLPASALELELTENAVVSDIERTRKLFHRLSALGVQISIDDFGTGLSSLAYVKKLDVDRIKADKAFVTHLVSDKGDQAIIRAILSLCDDLNRVSVAEGIENIEIATTLAKMGCQIGQGDYFGKAMPATDFTELLEAEIRLQGQVKLST